jgi:hypothetical protein
MPDARQFNLPKWVPEAARQTFRCIDATPNLTEQQRALLHRLGADLRMREVWSKLHVLAAGREDRAAAVVVYCAMDAFGYKPPYPRKKKDQEAWLRASPPIARFDDVAAAASQLLAAMDTTKADAMVFWPTDGAYGFEGLYAAVVATRDAYERLAADQLSGIEVLRPPQIRNKNAPTAPQLLFSRFMSEQFLALFGKPLDEVVAVLTSVVFDLGDVPGSSTARGRRRGKF